MRYGIRTGATTVLIAAIGCAQVPLRARQDFRRQQFFATHGEVPPTVANAINTGHIIVGMDREEVWVVAGDPIRKSMFRGGTVEVWLYAAVHFHQGPATHGADSFRLVFLNGRLVIIDSL